jgi:hypothetical protein
MDGWRRVHRIFSFTGDPASPHQVVYVLLFPLALMVITGR